MSNPYNPTKSVCTMFCKRFYIEAFSTLIFFLAFTVEPKTCPKAKNREASFGVATADLGSMDLLKIAQIISHHHLIMGMAGGTMNSVIILFHRRKRSKKFNGFL